ncbi:MAG: proton-conducting transporter membrane subunit [Candidatus Omnitrophica bacterium]|nr:proton-conducting transporter membrane subunit [Candidatus Omnitrophota bacterium]
MLYLFIIVPLFILMFLNLPFRGLKRAAFWLAAALCLFQMFLILFPDSFFWKLDFAWLDHLFKFDLAIDGLGEIMLFCIGLVVFTSVFMGRYINADADEKLNFFSLLLIALAGLNGIVLVKDVFSLYVFIEITSVSSFMLISFYKRREALEATFKYLILSAIATILMLASISLIILISGGTSFSLMHEAIRNSPHDFLGIFAIGMFLSGLFIKAGLVPFHGWLVDAYSSAPSAVSVFLAGIATKAMGIYTLMRVTSAIFEFSIPIENVLMLIGAVSIIIGALDALAQNDFKRMLAYSSISQMGYIVLGFGCGTALGVAGAVFHLFNHTIFKSLLFVNSAALKIQTGTSRMDKLGGLARKMPLTAVSSLLAGLSTAGIPPLPGFWSKLIIIIALWGSGHYAYAVIAVLASLITLAYIISMQRRVFFGEPAGEMENVKEASPGVILPTLLLTLIVIVSGLFFPFILENFALPAGMIIK